MERTYTAVFERDGDWYIGFVPELPGANTQGRSLDEARANLREAIELVLLTTQELSEHGLSGKDVVREEIAVHV